MNVFSKTFLVTCHTDFVGSGSTFVVIRGMQFDGISYIPLAIQKGATKIVIKADVVLPHDVQQILVKHNVELVRVANTRKALAQLSAQAYNFPARKLKVIGITGTKGKTTTAFITEHILRSAGKKTALLSTVYNKILNQQLPTQLTTQQPDYLHAFFNKCTQRGVEYVVMEVAAQALTLHRVQGITFDAVVFTNFDQEHAEFYASIDDYFAAKCLIFDQVKLDAPIFINVDDAWLQKYIGNSKRFTTFSLKNAKCDVYAQQNKTESVGVKIFLKNQTSKLTCPTLIGRFNAYNCLAAFAIAHYVDIPTQYIDTALQTFAGVPGRVQMYELSNGARAVIDYAHTPSSFKAILSMLRAMTHDLIVVFGCGGDRDATKRPLMGAVAAQFADIVIVTTDNPRTEDPQKIIKDILAGINHKSVIQENDRAQAIKRAYTISQNGSIIALLGKGPDEYQLIGNTKIPFSESAILRSLQKGNP